MRIVTFNNLGTAHVLIQRSTTCCGKRYPGAQGEEARFAALPDVDLHLCGNCERVIETGCKWLKDLKRRFARGGRL